MPDSKNKGKGKGKNKKNKKYLGCKGESFPKCYNSGTAPVGPRRNGLDYEPPKSCPPDYSNVPDIRSWQMSPFSAERFDLNEIQEAEKLGYKGRAEVERLKKLYFGSDENEDESKVECGAEEPPPPPPKCYEGLLYQPYGPLVVASVSYSRPESNQFRLYNYLGPSTYSRYTFRKSSYNEEVPVPCQGVNPTQKIDPKTVYVPYGPLREIRITEDQYVPMGPAMSPRNQ